MGRIKIKDIEGSEADVRKLFQKSGCSLAHYLKIDDRKKIHVVWLWIFLAAFFIDASCVWTNIFSPEWQKVAVLGLFLLPSLLAVLVHFNYRNWALTTIVAFSGLILILIATDTYSPGEVARRIGHAAEKKLETK
ncbi:MAG TPA: hypothetical protein VHE34_06465 [Puia sp.]|uniref:hypothetical protein n=1 Tax=Puia sp. TaxID=2045100 RepID=UPI002B5CB742|nr:hypothetical protein [Puia sp.]HVU94848.1 hypothetical protein [Puia sp.]